MPVIEVPVNVDGELGVGNDMEVAPAEEAEPRVVVAPATEAEPRASEVNAPSPVGVALDVGMQ